MTTTEATALLAKATADDRPSAVNPNLTRAQAVKIMLDAVESGVLDKEKMMPVKRRLIERNIRRVVADR